MTPPESGGLSADEARRACTAILARVGQAVVGKEEQLRLVLAGLLACGHVLLEDLPGLGKTLTARSFAQALGLVYGRIQFTPDLLPADITGSFVYDQGSATFEFRAGPIFANLLLADEINRTPPRTQAALLEAMQERQVTVEGTTRPLPAPFHVLATANPIEFEGTYPLPEAQLDRFMLKLSFGYLDAAGEWEVLVRRMERRREEQSLVPVLREGGFHLLQALVEDVAVEESVGHYIVALVRATRERPEVLAGASPRGALALLSAARALALIEGRDFVVPEDVKRLAVAALGHRITLRPESYLRKVSAGDVVGAVLGQVPAPASSRAPLSAAGR